MIPALIWTLLIYVILGLSFLGWGLLTNRIILSKILHTNTPYLGQMWMGWAAVVFLLQLANLFLPLNAFVTLPLFIMGVVFFLLRVLSKRPAWLGDLRITWANLIPFTELISAILWIALRSITQSPDHYDSGLYHFAAIKWSNSYPIVRGLGNLHGRLAYNSSLFPYVAALDIYPIFNQGHHIANSFLLVLSLVSIIFHLRPIFKQPKLLLTSHPFRYMADFLALPALAYVALSSELSSPTPDLTSTILQIMLFLLVCNSLAQWREGISVLDSQALLIVTLAAMAVTIKLSNLAFAITVATLVTVFHLKYSKRRLPDVFKLFMPSGAMIILWCLRGVLLSGAPLYPSTLGYLSVPWAVPRESIRQEALTIFRWARRAGDGWRNIFTDWSWFQTWWYQRSTDFFSFRYPLYISVTFIFSSIIARISTKGKTQVLDWSILILPVVSLSYWFFTAPDLRFANAILPILVISSCLLLLLSFSSVVHTRIFIIIILIVFSAGNAPFIAYASENKWQLKPCAQVGTWFDCIPSADWKPIPEVTLTTKTTLSGLQLFLPVRSDQCWDAPLPCTPIFNDDLNLSQEGDLSSGFMLEPK